MRKSLIMLVALVALVSCSTVPPAASPQPTMQAAVAEATAAKRPTATLTATVLPTSVPTETPTPAPEVAIDFPMVGKLRQPPPPYEAGPGPCREIEWLIQGPMTFGGNDDWRPLSEEKISISPKSIFVLRTTGGKLTSGDAVLWLPRCPRRVYLLIIRGPFADTATLQFSDYETEPPGSNAWLRFEDGGGVWYVGTTLLDKIILKNVRFWLDKYEGGGGIRVVAFDVDSHACQVFTTQPRWQLLATNIAE